MQTSANDEGRDWKKSWDNPLPLRTLLKLIEYWGRHEHVWNVGRDELNRAYWHEIPSIHLPCLSGDLSSERENFCFKFFLPSDTGFKWDWFGLWVHANCQRLGELENIRMKVWARVWFYYGYGWMSRMRLKSIYRFRTIYSGKWDCPGSSSPLSAVWLWSLSTTDRPV